MSSILLVDDNPIQAATRKAILQRHFLHVTVATDPLTALSFIRHRDALTTISLVITDHVMPNMSGPDFVQGVRDLLPNVPIIVLSGMPDVETEYESLDIIFRQKPFAPEDLIALTRELVDGCQLRTA